MGCGSPGTAYIFFFTFHLVVSVILLNLFIALILDKASEAIANQKAAVNKYQLTGNIS